MRLKKTFATVLAVFAAGLCLGACGEDFAHEPRLSEIRHFRAYPVYYAGLSVSGNALLGILGNPAEFEDKREASWFLLYGRCKDPPGEYGCPPPLQIHSYSTCTRWAGRDARLFDLRGAKATKPRPGGGAGLEIFTGRTTVTIHAENQAVLDSAVQALREVHQQEPPRLLPPPVPGSLRGELPCQQPGK